MPGQQAPVAGCVRSVLAVDDDDRVHETVCEMLADGRMRPNRIGKPDRPGLAGGSARMAKAMAAGMR